MPDKGLLAATTGLVDWLQDRYKDWEGVKQFGDTPRRLERMYEDFCWTPEKIQSKLGGYFKTFEDGYNQMLVKRGIEVWTLCPHHLLPCQFMVTIGYIPDRKVLGLSKLSRVAEVIAKRPIMQEAYSGELADILMHRLVPLGVAVYIVGTHGCMASRGVRQHSKVVTSVIRGVFESQPETRAEFLALCRS